MNGFFFGGGLLSGPAASFISKSGAHGPVEAKNAAVRKLLSTLRASSLNPGICFSHVTQTLSSQVAVWLMTDY